MLSDVDCLDHAVGRNAERRGSSSICMGHAHSLSVAQLVSAAPLGDISERVGALGAARLTLREAIVRVRVPRQAQRGLTHGESRGAGRLLRDRH
eukprot:1443914-Rhodomonas_salina.1